MKKHLFTFPVLAFIIGMVLLNPADSFSQMQELNFKISYKIADVQSSGVEGIAGNELGTANGKGTAYFEDGNKAEMTSYFIFDYTDGSGDFTAYYVLSFNDGSGSILMKAVGTTNHSEDKSIFNSDVIFVRGSGKYAGITGSGTMSGERDTNVESGAEDVLEVKANYEIK